MSCNCGSIVPCFHEVDRSTGNRLLPACLCQHANEVPTGACPCNVSCYCRTHTCKPAVRKTNRERVTGSSASIQTVGTPEWLIKSIERTWSIPVALDAAADDENHVCNAYITKEIDALSLDEWPFALGAVFFNPPFKKIGKFCEKAVKEAKRGQVVFGLVLASVGSKWWREHVHGKADAFFISRIHFKGHSQVFMKDLAVLRYSQATLKNGGSYRCCRLEEGKVQDLYEASHGS